MSQTSRTFLRVDALESRITPAVKFFVEGVVWGDTNGNGVKGPGESGIANVAVDLLVNTNALTPKIASTKTDAQGKYRFELPGDAGYLLQVTPPGGMEFAPPNRFSFESQVNSDITDLQLGRAAFQLFTQGGSQEPVQTINAGLLRNAAPMARAGAGPDFGFGYGIGLKNAIGEIGGVAAVDSAGNALVLGLTASEIPTPDPTIRNPYLAKYDPAGKLLWRQSTGPLNSFGLAATTDAANNIYIAGGNITSIEKPYPGLIHSDVYTDSFVAKYSPAGTLLWKTAVKGPGADLLQTIAVDGSGNVFAGGTGTAGNALKTDPAKPLVVKLSAADGKIVSQTYVAGSATGSVTDLVATGTGGVQFLANTFANPLSSDSSSLVGMWGPTGQLATLTTIRNAAGKTGSSAAERLFVDAAGNLTVTGTFVGTLDFDPGAAKLERTIAGTPTAAYGNDIFIARYDKSGKPLWAKTIGGDGFDSFTDAARTPDGRLILIGSCSNFVDFDPGPATVGRMGNYDNFLLVLDDAGNFVRVRTFELYANGGSLQPTMVRTDPRGDITFTGIYNGTPDINPTPAVTKLPQPVESTMSYMPGLFLAKWTTNLPPTPPAPTGNRPPTVTLPASYTIDEGKSFQPVATAADPDRDPLTYAWDLNGDGVFTDGAGANPTLTWAALTALGLGDSTPGRTVAVRVSDGKNPAVVMRTTLKILNVAPTGLLSLGGLAIAGRPTSIQFSGVFDPSVNDRIRGYRYDFDFNNDGRIDQSGPNPVGKTTFARPGTYPVKAFVIDKDGGKTEKILRVIVA
jgi:SdrD B-like domain